jgi:colanic acid biosynthesis glycosyl transferase WcaI
VKIKIVGINYFPEVTGIAPYTTGLAEGLAAHGHEVNVVTGLPHYPEWRVYDGYRSERSYRETVNGVTIERLRHHVPEKPSPRGRIRMEASFARAVLTRKPDRPDVVIAYSPALLSTAGAVASARLQGVPVGVIVQDLYGKGVVETGAMSGRSANLAAQVEGRILRAATGVSVIHDRFVPVLTSVGVDPGAVTVIRNWTHVGAADSQSSADSAQVRRHYGWGADELIVVHAGNMGAKQGLENVIAAARLAAAELPAATIRFVLLGDGNQRPALQDDGAGVGALEFVKPLPDKDFRALLSTADVLLVNEKPGVGDMAVPSKLTTYFTTGKPVVAATDQSSGAAAEVRAAGAGVIVEPGNPRALVEAALAIGRDKVGAAQYGESGKRYSQNVLDRSAAIGRFDEWCRDLTAPASKMVRGR